MKKILSIIVLGLLWCNIGFAENVYDYLESNLKKTEGNTLILNTHNKHKSKTIILDRIEIWFSKCSSKSGIADRIYKIDKRNIPYSDQRAIITYNFNHRESYCSIVFAKFDEPYQKEISDSSRKKTKKSNSGSYWPTTIFFILLFMGFYAMVTRATKVKKNKKTGHFEVIEEEVSQEFEPLKNTPVEKKTNEFKNLAEFYNDYKSVDFTDPKSIMSKANKKQTEALVNIIMPCLQSLADKYPEDTQVVMILIKLVEDNLVSEEKFIEVQKNLKEMKNIGDTVGLNQKLMAALHIMVG